MTLHTRRGGRRKRLAPRYDRQPTHVAWSADARSLLFTAEDRGRVGLWRLPVAASGAAEAPTLVVAGGAIGNFSQSRDGSVLAFDRATAQHPPALFACRADGTGERPIETLNRALLGRHAVGDVRDVTIKGWGGAPVQMWITYPPNFDPKKKWPLLQTIHGGPHAAHLDCWHFRWNNQLFAARGFVVAAVNYHGSSGFGQKWLETIPGRYGEKEFADVEAGTDWMLRQGYVDRTRLVATGGSYGGFMVAFMNGHTDRYKAFVCHAGCYDWVSMMATDGYHFFADELGAFHWNNPALVMKQSPHHYVKRAKTPTLVMHGEQDFRVPATQALQYYDTLKAKKVPARLVYFPDENHWILKPQNSRLWYREFFDWLTRYAPGRPARARSADRAPTLDRGERRPVDLLLVGALAVHAALRGRIDGESRRRDVDATVGAFAVGSVAHPRERRVDLGELGQRVPHLGEVELGQSVGDTPFVAALLDPVAQAHDAVVVASGELRFHSTRSFARRASSSAFSRARSAADEFGSGHGATRSAWGNPAPLSHLRRGQDQPGPGLHR